MRRGMRRKGRGGEEGRKRKGRVGDEEGGEGWGGDGEEEEGWGRGRMGRRRCLPWTQTQLPRDRSSEMRPSSRWELISKGQGVHGRAGAEPGVEAAHRPAPRRRGGWFQGNERGQAMGCP